MTSAKFSIRRLVKFPLWMLVALGLLLCRPGATQASPQSDMQNSDVFGSEIESLIASQQDALSSGDPERILKTSSSVAAASLAILDHLDAKDQESRKTGGALPYAVGLLADLPAELSLFQMELNLGEKDHAAELKSHILSSNPETAQLHLELAQACQQGGALDDAVREAQRAVELDPGSRDAQVALGMAYWRLNGFQYNDDTLKAFNAAHQLDPDGYSTNLLLGMIEFDYQRFDDAAVHLRAAAAANPDAPEPWYQLGMDAFEQAQPKEAAEALEHFVSLAKAAQSAKPAQMRLALLTLDQIDVEQGETPAAAHRDEEDALKQQVLEATGANRPDSNVGTVAMGTQGSTDRSGLQDRAGKTSPVTATLVQLRGLAANALANIGTVLARKQDFAGAVTPLKYALEEDPSLDAVTRNLGLAACISGLYEDGSQALKQVVAAHPEDATARGCLGMADFAAGQYADAAASFVPLGDAVMSEPLFGATAAATFARTGDRSRADRMLSTLSAANLDPRAQARTAIAYLDLGEVDRARSMANAALGAGSQAPPEAHRVLGLLALEQGDAANAATEFQNESTAEHEGSASQLESQALLVEALIESGKTSDADNLRQKLMRANPDLAKSFYAQGQELLKNGDAHAGFEKLAAALALLPKDKEFRAAYDSARHALKSTTH